MGKLMRPIAWAVIDKMPNSAFCRLSRKKTNAEVHEYLLSGQGDTIGNFGITFYLLTRTFYDD